MGIRIDVASQHPTIEFAARELARYRSLMTGEPADQPGKNVLRIGLFADLLPEKLTPESALDDVIHIDVRRGAGIVAGANPRSCLLAVYRLLQEAGCRFLRPGPDGELIPAITWSELTVHVEESPSSRHRGICIEGAVSREIFLGIIDWLPKNGMNAYFIQFREGFTFFDRWYSHAGNPSVPSEAKSLDEIRAIIAEGLAAIQLRGLVYHAVGHGWTCEPFGIPGLGWEKVPEVPAGASRYFAELNGRRELFDGVPLNTNLCYGNPEVRDLIVNSIVEYAGDHPEVDLIHFWLADGSNNHCECPLCRDTRPADFYVAMLNQLDEQLTARRLPHKIVFLIYVDLLWAPEKEKLQHPERFVLMFAPITRTYSQPFTPDENRTHVPPYERNRLTFPKSAGENLAFLQPWQELSGGQRGDSFDFDYHLMWDHYRDPAHEELAAVLHADLHNLPALGLKGLVSCQVQRVFFPSPLIMAVLARTLWDRQAKLDDIAKDVYFAAFGPDGWAVRNCLRRMSELFHPAWLRREEPLVNPQQAARLAKIAELFSTCKPLIRANLQTSDLCRRKSWELLALFGEYAVKLAAYCLALASGKSAGAASLLTELVNWAYAHEPELAYVFDPCILAGTLGNLQKDPAQE
ncbi:MAG TPA: hypothetical protein DD640_01160 [Clostridiales bacterium]|nr:hypothetical protein [Clostridiales bacterium]